MSDSDRYLELTEQHQEDIKKNEINSIRKLVPVGPADNEFCDCGCEIPDQRRLAGYTNCVPCQTIVESKQRHYAKA